MALDEYIRKTFHEWTLTIDKVGGIDLHFIYINQRLTRKLDGCGEGVIVKRSYQSCSSNIGDVVFYI